MTDRFVCIHGHFYQPPRENPWTGRVEREPSAAPFHDWNRRITAECYAPNAQAEILDDAGQVAERFDNYRRISFDFGPTLLAWLAREAPEVHAAVVEADRAGCERFDGHGPAMAQAHGHLILPLASARDKTTQVIWGLADFEHRFGRPSEGMWLPETAADVETLEALAAHGVKYTVLAPGQARRVRFFNRLDGLEGLDGDETAWKDVSDGEVDSTVPYLVRLPSGRSLAVFFYDGGLAQAVAFGGSLHDGEHFARTLIDRARERACATPGLIHLATDGETYGHHHRHGEMALARALWRIEREPDLRLTTPGEFLALHPPRHEAEIVAPSSWSCAHGVGRWSRDCGCRLTHREGWNQRWRAPLRAAFDRLRDAIDRLYEHEAGRLVRDPWAARDGFVRVLLDSSPRERFLEEHRLRPLEETERARLWTLLEMQRHRMSMYTSCGWFFDDPAGLETVQVLRYAARAAELAEGISGGSFVARLLEDLEEVHSNRPQEGDGRRIWQRHVEPAHGDRVSRDRGSRDRMPAADGGPG